MEAEVERVPRGGDAAEASVSRRRTPTRHRVDAFVEALQIDQPELADDVARDAIAFLHLLLTHPRPPDGCELVRQVLLGAITRRSPRDRARQLRCAGALAKRLLGGSARSVVLEVLLQEHALPVDDSPASREALIALYLTAAKMREVGDEAALPRWDDPETRGAALTPETACRAIKRHVIAICDQALRGVAAGRRGHSGWSPEDLKAAILAIRLNYGVFQMALDGIALSKERLRLDFRRSGQPLWSELQQALERHSSGRACLPASWHEAAQAHVLLAIGGTPDRTAAFRVGPSHSGGPAKSGGRTLVVCRGRIPPSSDRQDKEEIERHLMLQEPLPLAPMPGREQLQTSRHRLVGEFPWACGVLGQIFSDLLGRAALGAEVLGMPPTLFVGPPGSGKSRLAHRIAQELDVPRLDLSLAGVSDTKVLGGTSRGWSTGRPNDLATLMATRRSASAIVLLDELDKALERGGNEAGIQAYLLGLLEPETASRHRDVFLKTECDFSHVMWIATANRLTPISAPLLSRMRVFLIRQPHAGHYRAIAQGVLAELAERWGVAPEAMPSLQDLLLPIDEATSAREVRGATEAGVAKWALALQRH